MPCVQVPDVLWLQVKKYRGVMLRVQVPDVLWLQVKKYRGVMLRVQVPDVLWLTQVSGVSRFQT